MFFTKNNPVIIVIQFRGHFSIYVVTSCFAIINGGTDCFPLKHFPSLARAGGQCLCNSITAQWYAFHCHYRSEIMQILCLFLFGLLTVYVPGYTAERDEKLNTNGAQVRVAFVHFSRFYVSRKIRFGSPNVSGFFKS